MTGSLGTPGTWYETGPCSLWTEHCVPGTLAELCGTIATRAHVHNIKDIPRTFTEGLSLQRDEDCDQAFSIAPRLQRLSKDGARTVKLNAINQD